MSVVTKEDSRLHFEVASVGGRFEGRLNVSGSVIEGTWTKGETSLALTLHRVVP